MKQLLQWDRDLFLWLNGAYRPWLDDVMYYISDPLVWIPAYMLILYLCIVYYKKRTWVIILFIAVLILATDTLSVHVFKNLFMRLRPSHEPSLQGLVHHVRDYKGGDYGFVSSHACNYFGLATFLSVIFARNLKYFTLISLFCALLISYSRIYLGVHYPGDILGGAILGSGIGFGFGKLFLYFSKYQCSKKEGNPETPGPVGNQ